jgi:hypothetical protein
MTASVLMKPPDNDHLLTQTDQKRRGVYFPKAEERWIVVSQTHLRIVCVPLIITLTVPGRLPRLFHGL